MEGTLPDVTEETLPDVFVKDPLLLQHKSQLAYGETLIWNLLVGRTIASGVPDAIDLHARDLGKIELRRSYDPDPPEPNLIATYRRLRNLRDDLSKADRDALEKFTMVSRGSKTARRVRDTVKDGRDLKRLPIEQDAQETDKSLKDRLKIAAIGFRVQISKLIGKGHVDDDLCMLEPLPPPPNKISGVPDKSGIGELGRTRLLKSKKGREDRWVQTVCSHIEKAVCAGSHIVVFPEFALPPDADLEPKIRDHCSRSSHPHSQFVFSGSRHEGGSNRGLVYYLKDKQPQPEEHWHYKVASARSLGENILGPHSDEFPTYVVETKVGKEDFDINVTIAVCYDSFDPSTFLSMVVSTATYDEYFANRIILVPSFNPSNQFVESLRDLSFLAACPVVYVNSLHGDARMFVSGVAVSDIFEDAGGRVLKQIEDQLESLRAQLRHNQTEARTTEHTDGLPDADAPALFRVRQDDKRLESLEALLANLQNIKHNGGLENLITVERCTECLTGHADDYGCASDILYYNIDVTLLRALKRFRTSYFRTDESFIPSPFRRDGLEEAVKQVDKKKAKREKIRKAMQDEMKAKLEAKRVPAGGKKSKRTSAGRKPASKK
jgi:hypothetical protein